MGEKTTQPEDKVMSKSVSKKILAVIGGFLVGYGVSGITITVMQSLVSRDWSMWVFLMLAVLTIAVVVGLAILSEVFVEYSFGNCFKKGYKAAQKEVKAEDDNVSN